MLRCLELIELIIARNFEPGKPLAKRSISLPEMFKSRDLTTLITHLLDGLNKNMLWEALSKHVEPNL